MTEAQRLLEQAFYDTNGLNATVRLMRDYDKVLVATYFPRTKIVVVATEDATGAQLFRDYKVTPAKVGPVSALFIAGTSEILGQVFV